MSAYDPERIQKIAKITPNFLDFARSGDDIQLGMDGDPAFPPSYRGTNRPVGKIIRVTGEPGSRVCVATFRGVEKELREGETAAWNIWEFTQSGFDRVMERVQKEQAEKKAADKQKEAASSYRGVLSSGKDRRMASLSNEVVDMKKQLNHIHNIVLSVSDGLARDIKGMSDKSHEPVFAGALLKEMESYRGSSMYRGMTSKLQEDEFAFSDEDDDLSD